MLKSEEITSIFKKNDLCFFSGVPDSTLKSLITTICKDSELKNIIAVNECEATALSAGYYLATSKIAIMYLQNSGLGKCVNPLTSLCDPEVYSIPLMLIIGWRGEPGKKDEPQHKKMGRIMLPLLDTLEIPYKILSDNINDAEKTIVEMKKLAEARKSPVAIIVREGTFEDLPKEKSDDKKYEMSREDAIKIITENLDEGCAVISTTGKTSRELFEYRKSKNENPRDFYTVGSMGCCSSIACSIALEKKDKKVFVFDGDGAILMQFGSLATIGNYKPKNLYHVIFDNNSYDSTGGQPTVSDSVDLEKIAVGCGYKSARIIATKKDLSEYVKELKNIEGPAMIIVRINKGSRKDLGRPTTTTFENKKYFMDFLEGKK